LQIVEGGVEADVAELARLYANPDPDTPTDARPLSAKDRQSLRDLCANYLEMCKHALSPFKTPHSIVATVFEGFFSAAKHGQAPAADLTPADVLRGQRRKYRSLSYLVGKHFALKRLRQLCRLYQQKWALAGPLAQLDAAGLRAALEALAARHLVLREGD